MQKNELDLLREIKSLYKKLTEEPKGQYKGKVYIGPSAYIYSENAKKLAHEVQKLRDDLCVDYVDALQQNINSWLGHEVNNVYPNSSNNIEEAIKSMNKSNERMERLFYSVFRKIEDL